MMPKHKFNFLIIKSKNLKNEETDHNSNIIPLKEMNQIYFAMNIRKC